MSKTYLSSPVSEQDWQDYYQLRWQILRAPVLQPKGSEQDDLEQSAYHLMLKNRDGQVLAVGRVHQVDAIFAQVRYMAVADTAQGLGAGTKVLEGLEAQAAKWGCKFVKLNARDTAQPFYIKNGYRIISDAPTLYGIEHKLMHKALFLEADADNFPKWCRELQNTWHSTIALSQFMQLNIKGFDGNALECSAPLEPNLNLHNTMFAGSIYTLATLTGWGMLYLQLKALNLNGSQVLADANIKYFKPITSAPVARCALEQCKGDLTALSHGEKVTQIIKVQLYSDNVLAAEFVGRYAVLSHKENMR